MKIWKKKSPIFAKIDSFNSFGIMTISFDKNITVRELDEINSD